MSLSVVVVVVEPQAAGVRAIANRSSLRAHAFGLRVDESGVEGGNVGYVPHSTLPVAECHLWRDIYRSPGAPPGRFRILFRALPRLSKARRTPAHVAFRRPENPLANG